MITAKAFADEVSAIELVSRKESCAAKVFRACTTMGSFSALLLWNNQRVFGLLFHHPVLLLHASKSDLILENFKSITLGGVLVACMTGLGFILLRLVQLPCDSGIKYLMAFGLGAGLVGEGLFVLGLGHLWDERTLTIYMGMIVLGGLAGWWMHFSDHQISNPLYWKISRSYSKSLLLGALLYGLWHISILALAPPLEWDVITYHLVIPKLYLQAGRIFEIPWLLHSHWPHMVELLYSLPLLWRADRSAALLHLSFALGIVAAIYSVAHRLWGSRAAWISASAMIAQPLFLRFSGTAHVDAAWTLFSFLSIVCAWQWASDRETPWLVASGLFGGLAVCTKLLAGLEFLPLAAWIITRSGPRQGRVRSGCQFLLSGGVLIAPWILKTWFWTGNPIWPFFPHGFGGSWGAPLFEASYRANFSWSGLPAKFWWTEYDTLFAVTPWVLFTVLAFWNRLPWPPFLRFFGLIYATHLIVLVHHTEFWRFIWPLLPGICLSMGWVGSQLWEHSRRLQFATGIGLVLALVPLGQATQNYALLPVLGIRSEEDQSLSSRDAYLQKALNIFPACTRANRELTQNDKILLFREIRGYYLNIPYIWGDPINQGLIVYRLIPNAIDGYQRLRDLGITHVLINEANYTYDPWTTGLMNSVIERHGAKVFEEGPVTLYKLLD
jgi:hypothetical protein